MRLRRTTSKKLGNTFFTSLLFLFVLATTLRVCTNKTMQECKLTNVFMQETQAYYLLENLMALTRDYAHQLTQNPRMPNLFLSVFAYRDKDKSSGKDGTIVDFNSSLSKEQIVPSDFPLQLTDAYEYTENSQKKYRSWDIKGGPIFWQDKKRDDNDERYLAEVFMLGELAIDSKLVPDWKARIVQTMEIERNPLCDFQLYAEGDTLINDNISCQNDNWLINFHGPVQINGNTRFQIYTGCAPQRTNGHEFFFYDKVNLAGHALRIKKVNNGNNDNNDFKSIKIPEKYCFYDNSTFYDGFTNPYTSGPTSFHVNIYSTQSTSSSTTKLTNFSNLSDTNINSFNNYEQYLFSTFNGNFMTRGRVYRPCGFDPISDWGYWYPTEGGGGNVNETKAETEAEKQNARVLDMCFGLHNLCKTSLNVGHNLFDNDKPKTAINELRKLDAYQMTEKARLVETQKVINAPGLEVRFLLKTSESSKQDSLKVPIRFPYVTYDSTHFPAKNDNLYLNYYLKLKFQGNSIFEEPIVFRKNIFGSGNHYAVNNNNSPKNPPNMTVQCYWQVVQNNKLVVKSVDYKEKLNDASLNSIFITKKGFDLVGYDDPSSPPHKLVESGDHWTLDSTKLRLHTSEPGYQFMYDRNRAKWIQLMDVDIGALTAAVKNKTGIFSTWASDLNRTIKINCYWQGHPNNANCNYNSYDSTSDKLEDIRLDYVNARTNFLNSYNNGSYNYYSILKNGQPLFKSVVDIGVRLINATELPEGGMTLICPYPLYIKGSFNTTKDTQGNIKPALIITDSLTILSDKWQDWRSSMDFGTSYLYSSDGKSCDPAIPAPTIYAHVITGRTHPNFWLQDNGMYPDFGIHDAFRTLEDISYPINFYGSLLLPYYCQRQWEPPIDFCHKDRSPSWFAYASFYLGAEGKEWAKMRTAPGMPTYLKVGRGRKTQAIGSKVYDTLVNDVWNNTTNAASYTFSTYHASLPNFLKYPKDPSSE